MSSGDIGACTLAITFLSPLKAHVRRTWGKSYALRHLPRPADVGFDWKMEKPGLGSIGLSTL
jgi:hypothetical protein